MIISKGRLLRYTLLQLMYHETTTIKQVATFEENKDGSSLSASFESGGQSFEFDFLRVKNNTATTCLEK